MGRTSQPSPSLSTGSPLRTFLPTAAGTITNPEIETLLLHEQGEGNLLMTAVCLRALGKLTDASSTRDVPRTLRINDAAIVGLIMVMTVDEARAACARVIADAESSAR
jgi:hypothetical protein